MKRLTAIIGLIISAGPLYAADVTLRVVDKGSNVIGFRISAGPSDPNVPIWISFIVELSECDFALFLSVDCFEARPQGLRRAVGWFLGFRTIFRSWPIFKSRLTGP